MPMFLTYRLPQASSEGASRSGKRVTSGSAPSATYEQLEDVAVFYVRIRGNLRFTIDIHGKIRQVSCPHVTVLWRGSIGPVRVARKWVFRLWRGAVMLSMVSPMCLDVHCAHRRGIEFGFKSWQSFLAIYSYPWQFTVTPFDIFSSVLKFHHPVS